MYEEFYNLQEKPFSLTPDSRFLFLSKKHKEAFSHLIYGIKEKKGFIEITGEIGTGKTTLCRSLLNKVDKEVKTALVFNPNLSGLELLKTILKDLGLNTDGESEKELIDRLNKFLVKQSLKGGNVVLIIDEAQNLSFSLLERIRMLSNLETEKEKLLQIILVGQPELHTHLNSPKLKQLNQRIAVRYHLTPLDKRETREYIDHRLKIAGSNGNLNFTQRAINEIYVYSEGIPRLINILCDHVLLTGYVLETNKITRRIVKRAIKEIKKEQFSENKQNLGNLLTIKISGRVGVTFILLSMGLIWLWQSRYLSVIGSKFAFKRKTSPIQQVEKERGERSEIVSLTNLSELWGSTLLQLGMSNPKITQLHKCLKKLDYYQGLLTDNFSQETEKAIINFQQDNHIKVDGIVGPETKGFLYYRLLLTNKNQF